MKKFISIALVAILAFTRQPVAAADEVFELSLVCTDKEGIVLAIETSLPDDAIVSVAVARPFQAVTATDAFTQTSNYFDEVATIMGWREPRLVPMDDSAWLEDLKASQEFIARLSPESVYEIGSISDEIELSAYSFAGGDVLGESVFTLHRPLLGIAASDCDRLPDPPRLTEGYSLEAGYSYSVITDRVPLMPAGPNAGGWEAIAGMVYLPAETLIHVLEVDRTSTEPWYHVTLPEHDGQEGWINSIALLRDGVLRLED